MCPGFCVSSTPMRSRCANGSGATGSGSGCGWRPRRRRSWPPIRRRCRLRAELDARGLSVLTLNAFPYGGFHQEVVKHSVYRPDWTDPARARYTADCAYVLAGLMPEDTDGASLSTLPLGWRTPWSPEADRRAESALRWTAA